MGAGRLPARLHTEGCWDTGTAGAPREAGPAQPASSVSNTTTPIADPSAK